MGGTQAYTIQHKKKKKKRPQPFCLLALDTFKSCRVNCSICYGHFLKQPPVVFCISQGVDFISVRLSVHACTQPRNSELPPRSSDEMVLLKKCSLSLGNQATENLDEMHITTQSCELAWRKKKSPQLSPLSFLLHSF